MPLEAHSQELRYHAKQMSMVAPLASSAHTRLDQQLLLSSCVACLISTKGPRYTQRDVKGRQISAEYPIYIYISADPVQRKGERAREEEFSYHSVLLLHWQASRSSSRYMVSVLLLLFSLGFRREVRQVFRSDSGFVRPSGPCCFAVGRWFFDFFLLYFGAFLARN